MCDGYSENVIRTHLTLGNNEQSVTPTTNEQRRALVPLVRDSDPANSDSSSPNAPEGGIERLLRAFENVEGEAPDPGRNPNEQREFTGWSQPLRRQSLDGLSWSNLEEPGTLNSALGSSVDLHSDYNFIQAFLPTIHPDLFMPSLAESMITCSAQNIVASPVQSSDNSSEPLCLGRQVTLMAKDDIPLMEVTDNVRILIHHWQTHVCHLMMPTLAPSQNPWLRLYLPMALQEPQTRERSCLLYAILATAAFNKAELSQEDRPLYRNLAREFKEKAEALLDTIVETLSNENVNTSDIPTEQALLAAALTMTSVEVFSGEDDGKCYENLLIARRIVQLAGGPSRWLTDSASATLFQNFRCLQIISLTSGWTRSWITGRHKLSSTTRRAKVLEITMQDDSNINTDIQAVVPSPTCEYTLDVTFGISMRTLRCVHKIHDLKTKIGQENTWSQSTIDEFIKLESDIFDVLDNPDAFKGQQPVGTSSCPGISDYVAEEIMENHVWAFHYSTAIFLRRALCEGLATIKPLSQLQSEYVDRLSTRPSGQDLVSKALEYLENVDALSSDMAIANTLWPGFIAAVEAVDMELRHRALIWFARAKRHGIGNIAKAKALVMEVWRRVDRQPWASSERKSQRSQLSHIDWREVMREKGMYIMLT
ncbi:fungal-specific transcription factor domain-containing protein [Hypoxylon crocopeplum]|nr:fungal-specific transcription factor domain-containing protein [Hypoxylon crocopeplum]